ncbi:DUF1289 domain-containing protein [Thioclava sp. BHET1]|nr:DUF1289 domain-containing protein [Thioclava sp. BHET1]
MKDDLWTRDEIESPCVKVCVVHPEARLCVGCLRTLEEIADWSRMTPEARREIMSGLAARRSQLGHRRGGRAARLARERG